MPFAFDGIAIFSPSFAPLPFGGWCRRERDGHRPYVRRGRIMILESGIFVTKNSMMTHDLVAGSPIYSFIFTEILRLVGPRSRTPIHRSRLLAAAANNNGTRINEKPIKKKRNIEEDTSGILVNSLRWSRNNDPTTDQATERNRRTRVVRSTRDRPGGSLSRGRRACTKVKVTVGTPRSLYR